MVHTNQKQSVRLRRAHWFPQSPTIVRITLLVLSSRAAPGSGGGQRAAPRAARVKTMIERRFHLLFVSDVRQVVYENFVYFILVVFFSFGC